MARGSLKQAVFTNTSGFCGVGVGDGGSVRVAVFVAMIVKVDVALGAASAVDVRSCCDDGCDTGNVESVGGAVAVSVFVGVGEGSISGAIALGTETSKPVVTTAMSEMVSTFPAATPTTVVSKDGMPIHKAWKNPMVAAAVSTPRVMLTNFLSPISRRETMCNRRKRLSRFSANVFN